MRNILLIIVFFFLGILTVLAQKKVISNIPVVLDKNGRIDCATPIPSPAIVQQHEKLMQQFMQRGTNLASPVAIPIKAHIVRQSNGSGGLSTTVLNDAIANMNTKYATLNMSFYLCGPIHYIDSDDFYYTDVNTEDGLLTLNNINDAVNIYFVGNLVAGASVLNGISAFPSADPLENRIILWNDATSNGVTLPHEMGHYWNLYHTHETAVGAELVNGSNCNTAGDLVCDTPADPCCYFYNSSTCTYTGTATDANGAPYNPMVNNLMSYYGLCRDIFTTGQYARMDAGYALRVSYMSSSTYTMACNGTAALAPTNVNLSLSGCGINIAWTDVATNEMGYIIESATSVSGPFVAIGRTPANGTSFTDNRNFASGTTYYYRVIAANSNANYSSVSQIVFSPSTACYCIPVSLNCNDGDVITNVKIEQGATTLFNRTSTCSENGYSLDPSSVATLEKGASYTFSMSNENVYGEGATAWIDFNKNGTFETSEKILIKTNATWATASAAFTVPVDAASGKTGMRVRLTYNSNPTDPCTTPAASEGYGETEDYFVNIGCEVTPPTATGASRCGAGTVTLTASGCAGGTINWYANATGGTVAGTGASFITPSISVTTTYYAACLIASCESNRVAAIATVIDNPAAPTGTGGSRCGAGTVTLTATGCAGGTLNWYASSTGGSVVGTGGTYVTPGISVTRTYYVRCTIGQCSSSFVGVTATVNSIPGAPTTTGGSRCGAGSVTLLASGCAGGTLLWYASLTGGSSFTSGGTFNTPSLGATTTYYVECSVNNCTSPRTSVTATITNNPSAPTGTGGSRCGAGTVTLTATGCAGGTLNWYAGATGGTVLATGGSYATPSLSTTTAYYVSCTVANCTSTRTAVTATVNVNISFASIAQSAGTYRASQTITSAANVATGTNYFAGKAIILTQGFQAGGSEVFVAQIQNCP